MSTVEQTREGPYFGTSRIADAIRWSWRALDADLSDAVTDPALVLAFVPRDCHTVYWELHFEAGCRTRADFLCHASLATPDATERPTPDHLGLVGDAASRALLRDLRSWLAHGDTRHLCHAATWLEMDGPLLRLPSGNSLGVSVGLDRKGGGSGFWRLPPVETLRDLFLRFQTACGAPRRGGALVERIHAALARTEGAVRHLSVMRGRPDQPAKIYVVTPKRDLGRFLQDIDWPGDVVGAVKLAEWLYPAQERAYFDLEFTAGLSSLIGFEFFSEPPPPRDPLRGQALARAVDLGLLRPAQAVALEHWVGRSRTALGGEFWPSDILRWFDLKFTSRRPGQLALKVYLGVQLGLGII